MVSSSSQLNCYKPSGAVPIFGAAAAFVISVCAGVILGAAYAFVNHHDPLVYLNVLLAAGLGWLLGCIVSVGIRKFRIRNRAAAVVIALAAFVSAYAAHWPVYAATVLVDWEYIEGVSSYDVKVIAEFSAELARAPEETWGIIREFNKEGVWSISSGSSSSSGGMAVRGIFLTLIWIAEALVICYFAMLKPRDTAGKPYSERQEKWLEPAELPGRIAFVENKEDFIGALSRGDYSALSVPLPAGEEHGQKYAMIELYADAFEPYVTVTNVSIAGGEKKPGEGAAPKGEKLKKLFRWLFWDTSKSKGETSTRCVVKYLKISPTAAQNILSALRP